MIGSGGVGAFIATIANVVQSRRKSVSEQKGSTIEHTKDTVDLVDELLQKQLKWMSDRMDQGEAVRQKEFKELDKKIDRRFDIIESEDKRQKEIINNVVEYLNGGFQQFMKEKRKKVTKSKKK